MMACIIMHNMIIEDECGLLLEAFYDWDPSEGYVKPQLLLRKMQVRTR